MKAGVYLGKGFEEIEALTVVDMLRRADIEVEMISIMDEISVTGSHSITVLGDKQFEEVDDSTLDIIILPGGMPGTKYLDEHEPLKKQLVSFAQDKKWIAAICAAPSILGKLGLLKGRKATCYPGFEQYLENAKVLSDAVVTDGNFITARGAGVAVSFALEIIKQLKSEELAEQIKEKIIIK